MADGTIKFDTKIDLSGFEAGLQKADEKAAAIKETIESINAQIAAESVESIAKSADDAAESVAKVEDAIEDTVKSSDDVSESIDDAVKSTDELADTFDDAAESAGGIGSKLASVGDLIKAQLGVGLIEKAAGALIDFGKKAIMTASDIEESQNVIDVTFGESASKIEAFADTASSQFGLTELQVKQFSGTFGAMVKSMGLSETAAADMALNMTGLTADMASFYNLDHETAFEKLRSGLSGETEPLKALGINMSVANLEAFALAQGIETAYDKMSEAERVQLRYNYIMDATSDSQGDFARTSDGFANQLRILSNNIDSLAGSIGAALLPAATAGLQALNGLFAFGGEENTMLAEINAVIDSITGENGLKAQIDDIRDNYAYATVKIRLDYKEARSLLADYETELDKFKEGGEYSGINLKIGMNGDEVVKLQNDLIALGYAIDEAEIGTYGQTTLEAVRQFQEASSLTIDGIAGVQTQAALISQTSTDLQETVAQLVALYPELQQYVGEDGLFTIELDQVNELIGSYKELARAKAYATMLSDYEAAYYAAEGQYELLTTKRDMAQESLEESIKRAAELEAVSASISSLISGTYGMTLDTADAESMIALLQAVDELDPSALAEAAKGIEGVDASVIERLPTVMESLQNGVIDDSVVSDLTDLWAIMSSLSSYSLPEIQASAETDITYAEEALTAANEGIDDAAEVLNAAATEYNTAVSTYQRMFGELPEGISESVDANITSDAEASRSQAAAVLADYDNMVAKYADSISASLQRISAANPQGHNAIGTITRRTHATGVSYVPFDGYNATLHVGERVLTAAENSAYSQGTSIDYTALAAALSGSQSHGDIVVTVDGHELARYMADASRSALAAQSKRLAKGRGL